MISRLHISHLNARLCIVIGYLALFSTFAVAQAPSDKHVHPSATENKTESNDLATQLQALRTKVADLETALQSQHQARYGTDTQNQSSSMSMSGSSGSSQSSMKMGGMKMGDKKMKMMKGMGGMKNMSGGSGGMRMMSGGTGGVGMGMGMMKGMGMMGRNPAMKSSMNGMGSMGSMEMPSALPGFAGASHLYHIGETGFFLDHPQHIALTDEQQLQLNKIKESSLLASGTAERKIDEAEQELWTLTAEAQPDIYKIEAKAKEIAQLQVDNRIAFIRSVGKAAEVLTEEQRQTLVGMAEPTDTKTDE